MAAKRESKAKAGKGGKRGVKSLPAKTVRADQAKRVKGGAADIFAKIGDIKGESRR
jgi:hypothetical protein